MDNLGVDTFKTVGALADYVDAAIQILPGRARRPP